MALDDVGGGMRDTTSEDDDGEDGVGPSGSWAEEEGRRGGEAFGRRTGAGPGGQGKGRPGSAGAGEPGQRGSASGGARSRAEGQGAGGKRKRITKQPKKKLRRDE